MQVQKKVKVTLGKTQSFDLPCNLLIAPTEIWHKLCVAVFVGANLFIAVSCDISASRIWHVK